MACLGAREVMKEQKFTGCPCQQPQLINMVDESRSSMIRPPDGLKYDNTRDLKSLYRLSYEKYGSQPEKAKINESLRRDSLARGGPMNTDTMYNLNYVQQDYSQATRVEPIKQKDHQVIRPNIKMDEGKFWGQSLYRDEYIRKCFEVVRPYKPNAYQWSLKPSEKTTTYNTYYTPLPLERLEPFNTSNADIKESAVFPSIHKDAPFITEGSINQTSYEAYGEQIEMPVCPKKPKHKTVQQVRKPLGKTYSQLYPPSSTYSLNYRSNFPTAAQEPKKPVCRCYKKSFIFGEDDDECKPTPKPPC